MQIITRHVETGELGQQVSYPLAGYHVTMGKNKIRQFITQLSLFTLSRCIDSQMLSLSLSDRVLICLH